MSRQKPYYLLPVIILGEILSFWLLTQTGWLLLDFILTNSVIFLFPGWPFLLQTQTPFPIRLVRVFSFGFVSNLSFFILFSSHLSLPGYGLFLILMGTLVFLLLPDLAPPISLRFKKSARPGWLIGIVLCLIYFLTFRYDVRLTHDADNSLLSSIPTLMASLDPSGLPISDQGWIHPFFVSELAGFSLFLNHQLLPLGQIFRDPKNLVFYSPITTRKLLEQNLVFYGRLPNLFLIFLTLSLFWEILSRFRVRRPLRFLALFCLIGNAFFLHFSSVLSFQLFNIMYPLLLIYLIFLPGKKMLPREYWFLGALGFLFDNKVFNLLPALALAFFLSPKRQVKSRIAWLGFGMLTGFILYSGYSIWMGGSLENFLFGSHGLAAFINEPAVSEPNPASLLTIWLYFLVSLNPLLFFVNLKQAFTNVVTSLKRRLLTQEIFLSLLFLTGPILPSLTILRKGKFWSQFVAYSILLSVIFLSRRKQKNTKTFIALNLIAITILNLLVYIGMIFFHLKLDFSSLV